MCVWGYVPGQKGKLVELPRRASAGGPGARRRDREFLADSPGVSSTAWGDHEGTHVSETTLNSSLGGWGDLSIQDCPPSPGPSLGR